MTLVIVAIIMDNERVLLCQRKRTSRYGLKWEFPGGKLEQGETAEACLQRELQEELGIRAVIGDLYRSHVATYADGGDFHVLYYRVTSFSGTPKNMVFETVRWVRMEEIPQFDLLEGNAEVVKQLLLEHAPAPRTG